MHLIRRKAIIAHKVGDLARARKGVGTMYVASTREGLVCTQGRVDLSAGLIQAPFLHQGLGKGDQGDRALVLRPVNQVEQGYGPSQVAAGEGVLPISR